MELELQDTNAIVTASSKGLGRATATELVREGATVVISSRNEERLQEAKSAICADTGADDSMVIPVVCDLSNEEDIKSSMIKAVERLGGLDVLVTNHGGPPSKSFDDATLNEFDAAYRSVLRSTITVIETTLPALRDGGGSITNIVSASAQEPPANHIISNVFRSGIYGLSKGLSREYATDDVRVNCVCPRGIMTDRIEYKIDVLAEQENISVEEATNRRREELPLGRLGNPAELGQAVAFLASDVASFTTGAVFEVDGGWSKHVF
ncbi:SDR family oxidoreductase [Halorussus salinisoli]|uniref:SDR family oxidoreductase n=1 Tax=Halorussus salinisoli TaxID=2558242 RepID=UPI0010C20EBD|nr:SDR family oxidoreductase [Halorussus salinisoli]